MSAFDLQDTALLLLQLTRSAEQKDLRDKVYDILGIINPKVVAEIVPDYNIDVPQVFTGFTTAVIRSTNSLELLRRAGAKNLGYLPSGNPLPPSWVEDLSYEDGGIHDFNMMMYEVLC